MLDITIATQPTYEIGAAMQCNTIQLHPAIPANILVKLKVKIVKVSIIEHEYHIE